MAGGVLACPPQPAASQPASPAPISRVSPRRAGTLRGLGPAGDLTGSGTAGSRNAGEVARISAPGPASLSKRPPYGP